MSIFNHQFFFCKHLVFYHILYDHFAIFMRQHIRGSIVKGFGLYRIDQLFAGDIKEIAFPEIFCICNVITWCIYAVVDSSIIPIEIPVVTNIW